ncbi:uncharacterized protein [Solanum tuberosum]|uniref:uncharacterized protein n=1 Tax=Solanum tuberosum TaxID=4113 RepID=UPI00073A3C6D|nr:PREDICTED: uncharacterized protein LOC107060846 [Solanum tuberosum]
MLRRCSDGDHVILIDVELSESFSNVIFIDVPESTPKKFRGDIIFIDDESNDNCITTQRERIKETSEYKKALEEELASRQKALAIQVYFVLLSFAYTLQGYRNYCSQDVESKIAELERGQGAQTGMNLTLAEEAKKLKLMLRRKKAESTRLLEIEKRQMQRVEEMRETQKKDVENTNLKEQIRFEVWKEHSKLEMTCHDMASVLCGLGITVGDGTSHEVRVSYKKALLKFHPDRTSRSDIRQQVEAEETFKLISRMKDKYLPTLWQRH